MKEINQSHLLAIPLLERVVKEEKYRGIADRFLEEVNACKSEDPKEIIRFLLQSACEYRLEIPMFKTIFFDLAWAVLEYNKRLWTKEEKVNGYSDIDLHWGLYPEYDGSFDDYESVVLHPMEYLEGVVELMNRDDYQYTSKVCYAFYIFLVQLK